MSRRSALFVLIAFLAVVAAVLALAPGRGYWLIDPDAAAYVGLARSLAAGDGYTLDGVPHAKFPPGFPLWLSLAIHASGDPAAYALMRDLVGLAALVAVALAFRVGRSLFRLGPGTSLLLAVLTGISVFLVQYAASFLRSETLFAALFLAALLAAERWRAGGGWPRALAAGVLLGAATLVRSAGIAAVPALLLARITSLRPLRIRLDRTILLEIVVFLAAALGATGMFALRNQMLTAPASAGYGGELLQAYALDHTKDVDLDMPRIDAAGMAARIADNVAVLALSLGKFLANDQAGANLAVHPWTGALRPGGALLLLVLLLGCVVALRRGLVIVGFTVPAYVALYLIWPFNQQQRFYLPILPLLLGLLGLGAQPLLGLLVRAGAARIGRWLLAGAVFAVAVVLAAERSHDATVLGRWSPRYALLLAAAGGTAVVLLALAVLLGRRRLEPAPWRRRVAAAGLTGLLLLHAAQLVLFLRDLAGEHRAFLASRAEQPVAPPFERLKGNPQVFLLLQRLQEEARPGDLVMSDIPKIIHVATGLRTTPFVYASRAGTIRLERDGEPVRFLYVSREIETAAATLDRVLAREPERFEVLHEVRVTEGKAATSVYLLRVRG